MPEYSRAWLVQSYKDKIVALHEQIDDLELSQMGVSYSLPTGHSLSTQGQLDALRNMLEYYEARLRALQPAMTITRGL